jgi:hypothetical protein
MSCLFNQLFKLIAINQDQVMSKRQRQCTPDQLGELMHEWLVVFKEADCSTEILVNVMHTLG